MLFSERSIYTMVHGIGLGSAALMGLAAALFYLYAARPTPLSSDSDNESRAFASRYSVHGIDALLTVIVGTYIIVPPYRATPPPGTTDLSEFPRSLVLASPNTAWLHAFAMESKEHMPWIASMLTTAVAFIAVRYRGTALTNRSMRLMTFALLAVSFVLVSFVALLGVGFVDGIRMPRRDVNASSRNLSFQGGRGAPYGFCHCSYYQSSRYASPEITERARRLK
jgi:hypothetical protein